jgi:PQQ-dependent dehydrogenase (methanol/ethanol family)
MPLIALLLALLGAATLEAQPAGNVGNWPMPNRDYGATRFSPLTDLTPQNVANLKLIWSFGTGSFRGHEGNPLVIGNRLYLHTPHPVAVYAFNLDEPGSAPLWKYAPPSRGAAPFVCCDGGIRGIAWHPSGRLYVPIFPGDLAAVDAATGRQIWRVRNGDPEAGITLPGAPLVVGNVVIVGAAGGEFGARGYLTGYAAATGKLLWRAYSTGSDAEVLLDGPLNPASPAQVGPDLGLSSWTGDAWRRGGGATWGWLSYDPQLNLLYHGTGGAAPLNPLLRPGDNKWTSSLFARDPATGRARWALQLSPRSPVAYDASNENLLVDLTIQDRAVKALVHFDHNGFVYTIDRATGRILIVDKYGPANWARAVDRSTGLPAMEPGRTGGVPFRGACPSLMGLKGHQPAAYSPPMSLFFVPLNNVCMDFEPQPVTFAAGKPYLGATIRLTPGPGGYLGRFIAWDAARSTLAWEIREPFPVTGGALATAGGVVFYATLDGWLKAVDARRGGELWRFRTPSGNVGNPISFAGPDGKQYLAIVSGTGSWAGAAYARAASSRAADPYGVAPLLSDLTSSVNPGGVLLVFGLP